MRDGAVVFAERLEREGLLGILETVVGDARTNPCEEIWWRRVRKGARALPLFSQSAPTGLNLRPPA
jgi:hypothetical protein